MREMKRARERQGEKEGEWAPAGLSAASAAELVISAVSAAVAVTTRQITQITPDYICTPPALTLVIVSFPGRSPVLFLLIPSVVQPKLEYALDCPGELSRCPIIDVDVVGVRRVRIF